MTGPVLVAGATGCVGSMLTAHLHRSGVRLRCGTRDPVRARATWPGYAWVRFDVDDPVGLVQAMQGVRSLVYLVHHLCDGPVDLVAREAEAAARVVEAANAAGVERIVYLGAPAPVGVTSEHLVARQRTGELLQTAEASVVELRASMIVGVGSESWRMVRDLALRLPVMVLPSWLRSRTQPIWIGDVVRAIALALELPPEQAGVYELPGPEVLSAREILERVARAEGLRPRTILVPLVPPRLSSVWLRWVTRADGDVARRLVHGLATDLVCADDGFWSVVGERPLTSFDRAVHQALAQDVPERAGERAWEWAARAVDHWVVARRRL